VRVDDEVVLDAPVAAGPDRALTAPAPATPAVQRRNDVMAARTAREGGEVVSLRLRALAIVDGDGRAITLLE
jgi:hypothetical protein